MIENPVERRDTLRAAWDLASDVLIVSARLNEEVRDLRQGVAFADGFRTGGGTFQKFYDQQELRNWIEQTLGTSPLPAAPGIFYVFKDDLRKAAFQASRYRARVSIPRISRSERAFAEHRQSLEPLMAFWAARGRLPEPEEQLDNRDAVLSAFGSIKRAFRTVVAATSEAEWQAITNLRRTELKIFLALSKFDGRAPLARLPAATRYDVKAFFGTYGKACATSDELLFSVGRGEIRERAIASSSVGKRLPSAIYIHESALDTLDPVLRLFEGCARNYVGRVDSANIIKLHRDEPRVSYLTYPQFDDDPHPRLTGALTVHLQTFRIRVRDYLASANPPILHRKEDFLASDDPRRDMYARLTRIEESKGLYENPERIGLLNYWNALLAEKSLTHRGHRLVRRRT